MRAPLASFVQLLCVRLLAWAVLHFVMHVFDHVADAFARLFGFHNYAPREKACAVTVFVAGLSLRDISERYCLTYASRESVRRWAHELRSLVEPIRKPRKPVAMDEIAVKRNGHPTYLWAAPDADSKHVIADHSSYQRSTLNAPIFLKRVLLLIDPSNPLAVSSRQRGALSARALR